jgi:hypothetical protein
VTPEERAFRTWIRATFQDRPKTSVDVERLLDAALEAEHKACALAARYHKACTNADCGPEQACKECKA